MFCEECGKKVKDGLAFCPDCGTPTGMTAQEPPKTAEREVWPQRPQQERPAGQRKRSIKFLCCVWSVFCCILVVLAGVYVSVISSVRRAVSEDAVHKLVEETDLAKIKLKFLEDGGSRTLSEYIYYSFDSDWRPYINEDGIGELLNKKFVKKFLEEKINDYVGDFLTGDGNGRIEAKELRSVLNKNEKVIMETLGIERWMLSGNELESIVDGLEKGDDLKDFDLSRYRRKNKELFSWIKTIFSTWLTALLLGAACILTATIFLVQEKKINGLIYTGVSLTCIGVTALILGAVFSDKLAALLNDAVKLGRSFSKQLLEPLRQTSAVIGGVLTGVGVACLAAFLAVKLLKAQKAKAPVKMR